MPARTSHDYSSASGDARCGLCGHRLDTDLRSRTQVCDVCDATSNTNTIGCTVIPRRRGLINPGKIWSLLRP